MIDQGCKDGCSGHGCNKRAQRGLPRFCRMESRPLPKLDGFPTYAQACENRQPGQRVRCIHVTGTAPRFILEAAKR